MMKLHLIANAIISGRMNVVEGLIEEAISEGLSPSLILNDAMLGAMQIVGAKYQANEFFVPDMMIAARTLKLGINVLKSRLATDSYQTHGTFIIGTVAGDQHDIGKNLVSLYVESVGFKVIDLGVDVPAERFIEAVRENPDCKIVALSALLTTTFPALADTVKALTDSGCREQVKIMVGGGAITQELADQIGADAYTPDAYAAALKAVELTTPSPSEESETTP